MKAVYIIAFLFVLTSGGQLYAQPYQFRAAATTHAIAADVNGIYYLDKGYTSQKGYLRAGMGVVYSEESDDSFKFFDGSLVMGSDEFLYKGVTCELGFKGIIGKIEKDSLEGDMSALAFSGLVSYPLDKSYTNDIPFFFYGHLAAAPKILSFQDLDTYLEANIGLNVFLIENASVNLSYRYFSFDVEEDHRDWEVSDGAIYFGISINMGKRKKTSNSKKTRTKRRGNYSTEQLNLQTALPHKKTSLNTLY